MEKYIVIEMQTNAEGAVATLSSVHDSYNTAQQKYHMILAAAAVSDLPLHSAAILSPRGELVASQYFDRSGHIAAEGE